VLPRGGLSPKGDWLPVRVIRPAGYATILLSLNGVSAIEIAPPGTLDYYLNWRRDGRMIFLSVPSSVSSDRGRTYAIPLKSGKLLPDIPPGGFRTEAQISQIAGAQRIESLDVAPGAAGSYVLAREALLRNLFLVPCRK
jgi:hypothetical protein